MKKFISLSIVLYSLYVFCMPASLYSCEPEKATCDNPTATKRARFEKEHTPRNLGESELAAEGSAASAPAEFTARPTILLPAPKPHGVLPAVLATKDSLLSPRECFEIKPRLESITILETTNFPSLNRITTKIFSMPMTPFLRAEKPLIHTVSSITKLIEIKDEALEAENKNLEFIFGMPIFREPNANETHIGTVTRVLCELQYSDNTKALANIPKACTQNPYRIEKFPFFKGEKIIVAPAQLT